MYQFAEPVRKWLYTCGWSEERSVNIDAYLAYFAKTGQPTSEVVLQFLRSFGGLTLTYVYGKTPDDLAKLIIDPLEDPVGEQALRNYATAWMCQPLCVVGDCVTTHDVLLMSMDGALYSAFDSWMIKLGDSVEEMISKLFLRQAGVRILKPAP